MKQMINLLALEKEVEEIKVDAKIEEINNARENYRTINLEAERLNRALPYPDITPYTIGSYGYDSVDEVQFKKRMNKRHEDKIREMKPYVNEGKLYCGHFRLSDRDIYMMDNSLNTKILKKPDGSDLYLINVNDATYKNFVNYWRYPADYTGIEFSRNVIMKSKSVQNVDVVFDNGRSETSDITDGYLRKALLRNKNNANAQSIIQTIQRKQDYIRTISPNESFIVQGCAGSGKTMVLLHRLRYLIFNEMIKKGNYLFLTPSIHFKNFIKEISNEFNIDWKNVLSYSEYYMQISGKTKQEILDELVFQSDYLKTVYSYDFLKSIYNSLFDRVFNQTEQLIELCEDKFNKIMKNEFTRLEDKLKQIDEECIYKIESVLSPLKSYLKWDKNLTIEDIEFIVEYLSYECELLEQKYYQYKNLTFDSVVIDESAVIQNDLELVELLNLIEKETNKLERAPLFLKKSHQKNIDTYTMKFDTRKEMLLKNLSNELDLKRKESIASILSSLCEKMMFKIKDSLDSISKIMARRNQYMEIYSDLIKNFDDIYPELFNEQMNLLMQFIEISSSLNDWKKECVSNLKPCIKHIRDFLNLGKELIDSFKNYEIIDLNNIDENDEKDTDEYKTFSLFTRNSYKQQTSFLSGLLFGICKSTILKQFNYKMSNMYKHYWYLYAYCKYLSGSLNDELGHPTYVPLTHIFIDEAQDLSKSEIDFVFKINTVMKDDEIARKPIFNMFGDINQTITSHAIVDWNDLSLQTSVYKLEENFRNTNQIVDYCNEHLPIKMTKIGIDLQKVNEFDEISSAVRKMKGNDVHVCIVKDEYIKKDLLESLNRCDLMNFVIYTVKEAKGLEFKEVFVFEQDMTVNEKYISFTRPLSTLNVVKKYESIIKRKNLIVEGEDTLDEIDNENFDTNSVTVSKEDNEIVIKNKDINDILDFIPIDVRDKCFKIELYGELEGEYIVIPYKKKLKKYTSKKLDLMYILIEKNNREVRVMVSPDSEIKVLYVSQDVWDAHIKEVKLQTKHLIKLHK